MTMDGEPSVSRGNVIVLPQGQHESLMFQRVLLKQEQRVIEEPKHSKRVLKTKCKMQGRCCNLIIDGGSKENMVSTKFKGI